MSNPTNRNNPGKPNIVIAPIVYTLIGINKFNAFIIMLKPYSRAKENTIFLTILNIILIIINICYVVNLIFILPLFGHVMLFLMLVHLNNLFLRP